MSESIFIATANSGKVTEFRQLLHDKNIVSLLDFELSSPEESGITFIENALIKARHACEATKMPALADDSGLVVPELNGEPGIYSSRYAGESGNHTANIDKLLQRMSHLPPDKRQAYFVCILVYLRHANDPMPIIATGYMHGIIHHQPQGLGGFGYDPVFYVPEHACTAAELSPEAKNAISHRAKAMRQLIEQLNG